MIPQLKVVTNYQELSLQAAETIAMVLHSNPQAILLLPTGKTPVGMYEQLVDLAKNKKINFKDASIFMLDEYYLGEDYRHYIERHLIEQLPASNRPHLAVLNGKATDLETETARYEHALRKHGVDLAVLGVNAQGHIGFNEPGSPFDSITRLVKLSSKTVYDNRPLMERVKAGGDPYTHALTVGIDTILSARRILIIASGAEKSPPLKHLFNGGPDIEIPITALLSKADRVTVLADREAASFRKNA